MAPKKTAAAKRARSPEQELPQVPNTPVTWAHTPATVAAWKKEDSLLFLDLHATNDLVKKAEAATKTVKVAGFDMDDTLVMSKTGKVFAEGRGDWKYIHPDVPPKLQKLHQDGYRIVIFTNQSGIGGKGWNESKASDIRGKIIDIGNALSIPISAWIATTEDKFRKPGLGMWQHYLKTLPYPVDIPNSFYCGDAAGRMIMTLAGRKKDFSCSDRKFAINAKIPFFTPEEYFGGMPASANETVHWDGPSQADLAALPKAYPQTAYHNLAGALECVIMVGYPGSGKSTFFKRFFAPHNYVHINRDTLKDMKKCVEATRKALSEGKSVVVDNTNPSSEDRKPFIDVAKQFSNCSLRAIHMDLSKEMAFHMNVMRDRLGISPRVSSIGYNIFKGKFVTPTAAEGFSEVVVVPAVADFSGLPDGVQQEFFMLT